MAEMADEYRSAAAARHGDRAAMVAAVDSVDGGEALGRRIARMALAEYDAFAAAVDGDDFDEAVAVATGVRGGGLVADLALLDRERWRVLFSALASRDRVTRHAVHPDDTGSAAP